MGRIVETYAEKYIEPPWDFDENEHRIFLRGLAPIALFTYNRLEHLKQTVEALQRNVYAEDSTLICYSDAARSSSDISSVSSVRSYLHTLTGFKEVQIIERDKNMGLADNIIDGITSTINHYGKIIVLEDDLVTSKYFLKYMNDALNIYEDDERVMEIAGHVPFYETGDLPETIFSRFATCWGWGTWRRSWDCFCREPEKLRDSFSDEEKREFCLDGYYNNWRPILKNCDGTLRSWAIFWIAAIFRKKGLCLNPRISLVNNIGIDGSGVDDFFNIYTTVEISEEPVKRFTLDFTENQLAREYRKHAAMSSIPQAILTDDAFDYIDMENDFISFLREKEVIVFGAAQVGRSVRELLEKSMIRVSAFCDNDKGKLGNMMEGLPVISIEEMQEKNQADYFVVVALQRPYSDSVKSQLNAKGVFNYIDFTQIDFAYGVDYYSQQFIVWQAKQEERMANELSSIFCPYTHSWSVVADIGSGCGYLLKKLRGRELIGVEQNPCAVRYGQNVNKLKYVSSISVLGKETIDVAVSAYALEKMESPLEELQNLYKSLKSGGQVIFIVSGDSNSTKYNKGSREMRLYSWNQLTLGNLFKRAGFHVIAVKTDNMMFSSKSEPYHLIIAIK